MAWLAAYAVRTASVTPAWSGGLIVSDCFDVNVAVVMCEFELNRKRLEDSHTNQSGARRPGWTCSMPQAPAVGNSLPGLNRPSGIERIAKPRHDIEVVIRKHAIHETDFLQADAVLARNAATAIEAFAEDLAAGGQHTLDFFGMPLVEQQNRDANCRRRRGTR